MAKYKKNKKKFKKKAVKKKKLLSKEFLLGAFIVFIMVGSGFGIMFGGFSSSGGADAEYGDHSFKFTGNMFATDINGRDVKFYYLPQEVEHINVSQDIMGRLKNTMQIDITSDYDSPLRQQIAALAFYFKQNLEKIRGVYVRNGFLQENEYNVTVITCDDATPNVPVIVMKYSNATNTTSIKEQDNCIIIEGESGADLAAHATRMMYGIVGIIE